MLFLIFYLYMQYTINHPKYILFQRFRLGLQYIFNSRQDNDRDFTKFSCQYPILTIVILAFHHNHFMILNLFYFMHTIICPIFVFKNLDCNLFLFCKFLDFMNFRVLPKIISYHFICAINFFKVSTIFKRI